MQKSTEMSESESGFQFSKILPDDLDMSILNPTILKHNEDIQLYWNCLPQYMEKNKNYFNGKEIDDD